MDYQELMQIDTSRFDEECLHQAGRCQEVFETAANAEVDCEEAKERMELVEAELDHDIRENPEAFKIVKITEPAIKGAIIMHQRYKNALAAYLQSRRVHLIVRGACTSVCHRKDMLELIDRRKARGEYAEPKTVRPKSEIKAAVSHNLNQRIGDRMNGKRRPVSQEADSPTTATVTSGTQPEEAFEA